MTKEDFISRLSLDWNLPQAVEEIVKMFFASNVCIPKGKNPHPYSMVLHKWIEGAELEYKKNDEWVEYVEPEEVLYKLEYRIKPSEPVYEWMWYDEYGNIKWWTIDKSSNYAGENDFFRADQTKRIRL